MPDKDSDMSEADRRMANHIAELAAQTTVARMMELAKDKKFAADVMETWGGEVDRTIGRGLRRLGFYVLMLIVAAASAKLGLMDKIIGVFKP